ncbi:hypothetical protein AGMMS49944_25660 [Spirochaetia bacterium]|nr:hypothetical protein AGMMS49944_25660 [Spirochaetia bacterium]
MVKGAWIINLHTMRCKNWGNGIEVGFHFDENGRLVGKLMPLPATLQGTLAEKIPREQDRIAYIRRIWQRAAIVFYRTYYRHLFREYYTGGRTKPKSFSPVTAICSPSTSGLTLLSSAARK